jgi:hypothetical protein
LKKGLSRAENYVILRMSVFPRENGKLKRHENASKEGFIVERENSLRKRCAVRKGLLSGSSAEGCVFRSFLFARNPGENPGAGPEKENRKEKAWQRRS